MRHALLSSLVLCVIIGGCASRPASLSTQNTVSNPASTNDHRSWIYLYPPATPHDQAPMGGFTLSADGEVVRDPHPFDR